MGFSRAGSEGPPRTSWDETYNLSKAPNLWGSDPVPFIDKVIQIFRAAAGRLILDIPCGDGRNTVPLALSLPFVIGADTSRNALKISSHVLASRGVGNCVLQEANIFATPFADSKFDCIFCWDLLGHLRNARRAIAELCRISKPGGLIVGSVFSIGDSTRGIDMVPIGDEEYIYFAKFYFKFYSEREVQDLILIPATDVLSLDLVTWDEPPHEGYREYVHSHESWAFTLKKHSG